MLPSYLNTLKTQGNFTFETISNLSGIPESTVKNIFSGKTEDPRFETVSALVKAMGGSLDAVYCAAKKEDVQANSVITLKETYEHRIKEIKEHYEQRISDLEKHYEKRLADKREHIETILLDKKWFRLASVFGVAAIIGLFFIIEFMTPGHGWFTFGR
jgi:transcriptional regulator with XRE-family HTH domain